MDQNARLIRVSYPDGLDKHTERRAQAVADAIMDSLGDADLAGLVVEVTLDPGTPLAQGNYYPHIQIRERKDLGLKRESAEAAKHEAMLSQWSKLGKTGETADAPAGKVILAHGVK
jgi:hypothetical protein